MIKLEHVRIVDKKFAHNVIENFTRINRVIKFMKKNLQNGKILKIFKDAKSVKL